MLDIYSQIKQILQELCQSGQIPSALVLAKVKNVNGLIKFDMSSAEANLKAFIKNVPMSVKSKIKNNIADMVLDIPRINPNFFIKDKKFANLIEKIRKKAKGKTSDEIEKEKENENIL